ncbi:hypothetical protein SDC9_116728 [bioreactor metagenome]|uniref:HK97 gp10 family phage protein n=1 Tax=bioreactor metagenome TaxID=1076179 RepID=A0A645BWF1_9ZZZZ
MGRGFRVNFSVPELQIALNQLSAYDGKTAAKIEDAVSRSTKNISKGAKSRVRVRTGKLKKSISSRFDKKSITGYVAAKTSYAHLIEFGAKVHNARPPFMKSWTPESPYMRPSYEQEKPVLIRDIEKAVKP